MRKLLILGLVVSCFAASIPPAKKAHLDSKIKQLTTRFEAMQQTPGKRIPDETLRKAQGIVLLDRTKAGFLFGFQGGAGVTMVKDPSGQWGPAAFVNAAEASLGPQIGFQRSFIVLLLMTTNATRILTEPITDFGGEARGTADTVSGGVEGVIEFQDGAMLVFDDRKGLYGGAVIKGGAISPDADANLAYYGEALTMRDILFDRAVHSTESAAMLAKAIVEPKPLALAGQTIPNPKGPFYSPKNAEQLEQQRPPSIAVITQPVAPAPSAPLASVATEHLLRLLTELDANRQTNALQHLNNYLAAMSATVQSADAATTLAALEQLRAGRTTQAIEVLEARLDAAVNGLDNSARAGSSSVAPEPARTLERARQYRTEFPRKTGDTNFLK